jgi:deoxyribodipyrimidine photo-lyase
MRAVPAIRIRVLNDSPLRREGDFVLYWMVAQRRLVWNFALQRAVALAAECRRPLLILEAVRADYPLASDRHHAFLLEGMREHEETLRNSGVGYYPYVEPEPDAGSGLLAALIERAVCVVTDDHPGFFYPRMLESAARQVELAMEAVDSCGILPLAQSEKAFARAYDFRRHLQRELSKPLREFPWPEPLRGADLVPFRRELKQIEERWPRLSSEESIDSLLSTLPIDHGVARVKDRRGGTKAAQHALRDFLETKLDRYVQDRNQPERRACSRLSAHLHYGHIASHEIFTALAEREAWNFSRVSGQSTGARSGWWGMSEGAEAFLDQLITWRELGFNGARFLKDYREYDSLPDWARATLQEHEDDPRPYRYTLIEFEEARTHDPLWNAAQRQLVREGEIHNYLRMLWGKKILHWSASPREALQVMLELNDKYALDGRDPNSISGIFWVLGRYDRAWGPERAIFGKIRYMSSKNTARKVRVKDYVENHANQTLF